jgi:hypothetical protein
MVNGGDYVDEVISGGLMASLASGGEGGREELKSQFSTREGTYRLASAVEFARSTRPLTYVPPTNNTQPQPGISPPVRVSFVANSTHSETTSNQEKTGGAEGNRSSPESPTAAPTANNNMGHANDDSSFAGSNGGVSNGSHEDPNPDLDSTPHRFCLNIGNELFVYPYMGVRKVKDFDLYFCMLSNAFILFIYLMIVVIPGCGYVKTLRQENV